MKVFLTLLLLLATALFAQHEHDFSEFEDFIEPTTTVGGYGELHYNWSKADGADEATKVIGFSQICSFPFPFLVKRMVI